MGVKRVNRKVLLVLAVALVVLLVGRAQRHEAAAPALPVSAGDWTASQAGGTYTETGSYGGQQLALVFAPGQDVSLNVSGPAGKLPGDDDVPFHATFDDNASFAFDGDGSGGDGTVQAPVNDSQVAGFTRHLGDGGSLVLSFDDQQTAPLVFPLDGAGATFNALAAAMRRAGVAGQWGAGGGPSAADTVAAVFGLGGGVVLHRAGGAVFPAGGDRLHAGQRACGSDFAAQRAGGVDGDRLVGAAGVRDGVPG